LRVKGKKIIDVIEINRGFVMIFKKIPPKPIWSHSWRRITSAAKSYETPTEYDFNLSQMIKIFNLKNVNLHFKKAYE
jgi:hypothetical protein